MGIHKVIYREVVRIVRGLRRWRARGEFARRATRPHFPDVNASEECVLFFAPEAGIGPHYSTLCLAARTLQESMKAQGKGGYVDTWLFQAMAQQRLGRGAEARRLLTNVEGWLKVQKFATWQDRARWRSLLEEARRLILTMPRATE